MTPLLESTKRKNIMRIRASVLPIIFDRFNLTTSVKDSPVLNELVLASDLAGPVGIVGDGPQLGSEPGQLRILFGKRSRAQKSVKPGNTFWKRNQMCSNIILIC